MAIAIKGITCKITAIITAIKTQENAKNYLPNLQGVGIGQNTVAIKIHSTNKGIFFLSNCLSFDIGNVIYNA